MTININPLLRSRALDVPVPNKEPMRLAEAFQRARYQLGDVPTIARWARAWWSYDGTKYVELDDERLVSQIQKFLDVAFILKTEPDGSTKRERIVSKAKTVSEVRSALLSVVPDSQPSAPHWTIKHDDDDEPEHYLPCLNGMLDLRRGEILPSTPRLFATMAIAAEWQPHGPAPAAWLEFLAALWPDDEDSIRALQQMFGYLLTSDTRYQKLFAIVGPKRSGKSTIGRVLKTLLGENSVVSPTLASLEQPFGLAPLVGKSVALIGDARLGGRGDQAQVVERLLSISGEDPISVNRKNRDPIDVRLRARVVLISNELPRLYDTSGALASRFLILQTQQSFLGKEDIGLADRLTTPESLAGIFRWAMAGREDLLARGHFVSPAASEQMQAELEALSSPITVFLADRCIIGAAHEVEMGHFYEKWSSWCKDNGRDPTNKQLFGRDLRSVMPTLKESTRRRPDGPRLRFYHGVGLA